MSSDLLIRRDVEENVAWNRKMPESVEQALQEQSWGEKLVQLRQRRGTSR